MPKKVIQFSSSACYPVEFQTKNNYFLLKENMIDFNKHIGTPDLIYGWAKLNYSEYLGKIAFEKNGIEIMLKTLSDMVKINIPIIHFQVFVKEFRKYKQKKSKFGVLEIK